MICVISVMCISFLGFSDFYDGSPLASFNDVIVVTVNYRLGVFGEYVQVLEFDTNTHTHTHTHTHT